MSEVIYTDPLGTKVIFNKDAEFPYTPYIVEYPESTADGIVTTQPEFLPFQVGWIKEHGVNGCTNELMLYVLKHRLTILDNENHHPINQMVIFLLNTSIQLLEVRSNERKQAQVFDTNIQSSAIDGKIKKSNFTQINGIITKLRSGIISRTAKIKKWSET